MLKELVKDGTLSVVKAAAKAEMTVEQFEKELDKFTKLREDSGKRIQTKKQSIRRCYFKIIAVCCGCFFREESMKNLSKNKLLFFDDFIILGICEQAVRKK